MARCAHAQLGRKVRKLPKCSKCKMEFNLVMSSYEGVSKPVLEWECSKCHKVVPRTNLKEEEVNTFDIFLEKWCKDERERRRDLKQNMQPTQ